MAAILYPYRRINDVVLDVTEMSRDGSIVPIGNDARDLRQIWLLAEEEQQSQWSTLDLRVAVRLKPNELAEVEESGYSRLDVSIVGRCARAELRQSVLLDRSAVDPARWTGSLSWDRRFVAGTGEMHAAVGGIVDGGGVRLLGQSPPWSLHFDATEPFPTKGPINVKWADFGADPPVIPELSEFKTERFYVDLDDDEPTVYLNKGLKFLPGLLKDRRRRGGQKALHDVVTIEIGTKARLALVHAAATRVEIDGEEPAWPAVDWQKNVLEELFDEMPEHMGSRGLHLFIDAAESGDASRQLEQMIVGTIETQLAAGSTTRRAYESVLDGDSNEGG